MTNKERARGYFTAVNEYDASTIERMVDENYIQHNPFVPTGRAAFISFLPKLKEHGSKIENVRMLQDGPVIVMHHLWRNATPFGKDEMVAFHIIRFDEDGLIAEHWNVMNEVAPPNSCGRSQIDGETKLQDLDRTEQNKARVAEMFSHLVKTEIDVAEDLLLRYFNADFHQHAPLLADGIDGFTEPARMGKPAIRYKKQHAVFGEGNFVLSISEGIRNGTPVACYDLFRITGGMIAEHWSIYQDIPSENLANDNTMFNF